MARFALLLLFAAALLGAGCGGDDSDEADSGTATAPAEARTEAGEETTPADGDAEEGADGDAADAAPGEPAPGEVDRDLSRREYIRTADQICRQLREDIARRTAEAAEDVQRSGGARAARRLSAVLVELRTELTRESLERLKAEPRPPGGGPDLAEYLRRAERQVELLEQEARAVRENRPAASAKLTEEVARNVVALQKAARRFGFEMCGLV